MRAPAQQIRRRGPTHARAGATISGVAPIPAVQGQMPEDRLRALCGALLDALVTGKLQGDIDDLVREVNRATDDLEKHLSDL